MQQLDVHFASGREMLEAYWGYLTGGGLTIARESTPQPLCQGQPVALQIHIGRQPGFSVSGKVARVNSRETVVAFDTHESQNRLLAAALSERRLDLPARLHLAEDSHAPAVAAQLFELSEDGCCVRLDAEASASLMIGTEVIVEADGFRISGCVVSTRGPERCIIFGLGDDQAMRAVRAYLAA